MGQVVGSVTVEVLPDTSNFAPIAKEQLRVEGAQLQQQMQAQGQGKAYLKDVERMIGELEALVPNAGAAVQKQLNAQITQLKAIRDEVNLGISQLGTAQGGPVLSAGQSSLKDEALAAEKALMGYGDTLSMVTQRNLVGAASEKELAVAAEQFATAGVASAAANVRYANSLGMAASKEDIALLTRAKLIGETQALTGATERLGSAERRRLAGTPREALRGLLTGGGEGGGIPIAGLARLTAAGFAITAAFKLVGELTGALKVTGDEAFTTEGKLRNMGAALIGADIVGVFRAMSAEAKSFGTQVDELAKSLSLVPGPTPLEQMTELRDKIKAAREETNNSIVAMKASGDATTGGTRHIRGYTQALGATVDEQKALSAEQAKAQKEAQNYVNVLKDMENEAMLTAAGFDILATAGGNLGDVMANLQTISGQPGKFFGITDISAEVDAGRARDANDASRTDTVGASIARRTETLNDDLIEARKKEARARQRLAVATREERKKAYDDVVQATTERINLEQRIAAAQKTADEKSLSDAKAAYSQGVANQAQRLKIAADAADNVGRAEKVYVAYLAKEAQDRKLTEQERLRYQAELVNERERQKQAVVAAAKADIDYQKSLIDLRVQKAEQLTPNDKTDDTKAYRAEIAFWERRKREAKALGKAGREAVVEAEAEITSWKAKLRGLKGGGGGFTLQQLFQEASDQFKTFGSNVAGRNGVLSGQDERAAFGLVAQRRYEAALDQQRRKSLPPGQKRMAEESNRERLLAQTAAPPETRDPVAAASLSEAQKQTALLATLVSFARGKRGEDTTRDDDRRRSPTVAHHAAIQQQTHVTGV